MLNIEYTKLAALAAWPRNPKDHDLPSIEGSISRFGFVVPIIIDERTGKLVAGHGRVDALTELYELKVDPPKHIEIDDDGDWTVPTIRGVEFNSDTEIEAFLIAANQLTIAGGWDDQKLGEILSDLQEIGPEAFDGLGFDDEEIQAIIDRIDEETDIDDIDLDDFDFPESEDPQYKVEVEGLTLTDADELKEELDTRYANVQVTQYRD
jgi:hypothetical protein